MNLSFHTRVWTESTSHHVLDMGYALHSMLDSGLPVYCIWMCTVWAAAAPEPISRMSVTGEQEDLVHVPQQYVMLRHAILIAVSITLGARSSHRGHAILPCIRSRYMSAQPSA